MVVFGYDALGCRTQKTIAGVTTQFMYDGDNAVKEIKGAQNATLFGSGTDRFFSRTDASGERVMLTDGLGSVLGLVDGAGTTTTSYTYDAFGGTTSTGAISENSNQYTSRENDGTGLYFYRARYYQPKVGRFISEDPIRQKGSGMNWFVYTNNNPINLTDPSGLKPRKDPPTCYGIWGGDYVFGFGKSYYVNTCEIESIVKMLNQAENDWTIRGVVVCVPASFIPIPFVNGTVVALCAAHYALGVKNFNAALSDIDILLSDHINPYNPNTGLCKKRGLYLKIPFWGAADKFEVRCQ